MQSQKRFSWSGGPKYKPQGRCQHWGISQPNPQRSVFKHFGAQTSQIQTARSSRCYQGSSKISKAPQLMSRHLSSLLGCSDLQTSVTCTCNTPSQSSGFGFANTTPTGQTGRKNSRALGSMEENNLRPVGPSNSQWVYTDWSSPHNHNSPTDR